MYLAIAFLPLLGAILAGLIALFGAAARFPGEGPPPGMEDTATDQGPHKHEPQPHGGAAFHNTHDEPLHGDHDPHHVAVPAAAGSRAAELITTTLLMISCVLSWIAFIQVGFNGQAQRIPIFPWMPSGDLAIDWALRIDPLTAVMLVVVTTISSLVHLYSIGYMHEDPYRPQVRLDRDNDDGMATTVGRLRADPVLPNGFKYLLVSHNTKMGAAKGAVLVAEDLIARGYIGAP